MKCFHHTDADGKCSAYWVHKRYPQMQESDFIMIDYGMDIDPLKFIDNDEFVFVVDFSFEPDVMRKILKRTNNVIWIDHHFSAINKYKDFEVDLKGLRFDGVAGCMLTYCYFFEMNDGRAQFDNEKMTLKAPWMTKYIADHDVWLFEYGDETAQFKLGLDSCGDMLPLDSTWDKLANDISFVKELIHNGSIIEKFRNSIGVKAIGLYAFESKIDGIKMLCFNNSFGGSEWFGDKMLKKYDVVCSFLYMGKSKTWEYSLYSRNSNIDCSEICKKHGGGGHKGAAGFTSKDFIF